MRLLLALVVLSLAILVVHAQVGTPRTPVQKDFLALVKLAETGKSVPPKDIAAFTKTHDDLGDIMGAIYKPGSKKGLGFGKTGQGIEKTLTDWDKVKGTFPLAKYKADLLKIAALSAVMADVTRSLPPSKAKKPEHAKKWDNYLKDFKTSSQDLAAAAKANNAAKAKQALSKLVGSCTDCHSDFK